MGEARSTFGEEEVPARFW